MGRKFFFLLVLEFFLVPSTENPIFGYKLVLVWPNTFCQNTQCNSPIPQQFTIHGLWGYDSNSHIVVNCDNGPAFDRSLLNPIEKQLKVDMPGLDRDDEIHWRHQWNKHGKCSGMSVLEYFEEILTLKRQIDIDKSLVDKGIKSSFSDFYSAQKIAKAINRGTYFVPQLECNQDPSGAKQLFQVFFCVNKSMKLTDCYKKIIKNQSGYVAPSCSIPSTSASTRTDQVRFPPPPPRSPSPAVHDEF